MERLELSKQKLLGPKSSAVTNFATSVKYIKIILIRVENKFKITYTLEERRINFYF